jgi:hypothetical protein
MSARSPLFMLALVVVFVPSVGRDLAAQVRAPVVAPTGTLATVQPMVHPTTGPGTTLSISWGDASSTAQPVSVNVMSWSWGASTPAAAGMASQTQTRELSVVVPSAAAGTFREAQQATQMGRAMELTLTSVAANGRSATCLLHHAMMSQWAPVASSGNATITFRATFVSTGYQCTTA